jgi:rRNA-processing protein EBP2
LRRLTLSRGVCSRLSFTRKAYANYHAERQGADITATNEEDLFDVAATADDSKSSDRRRGDGKSFDNKRQKKDQKYGFGGKKRHAKSNDAQSSADGRGFSSRKMKGKPAGGTSKRPGKDKRAKRH